MALAKQPIPSGVHTVSPYLIVRDAAEALAFYAKAFGAGERSRMMSPDGKRVMHAETKIGDSMIMMTSEHPEWNCLSPLSLKGTPRSLHLFVKDADAAWKRAVDAGCTVKMPLTDIFWGDRFGKVTHPSGHEWSIATHLKDLSPKDIAERGAAAI